MALSAAALAALAALASLSSVREEASREEGEGETDHGWVLHTREKSFTVYAATRGEKTEWINAINKVRELRAERR